MTADAPAGLSCRVRATRGAFSLDVAFSASGRTIGIAGPSGAGKTTLLHALAGLVPAQTCRLDADGRALIGPGPVPAHRRGVGYVFQDARLFPHLTVEGNVTFGRRFARTPREPHGDAGETVEALLARFDLTPLKRRWVRNLSGGEARRVALARALAARPRLLLLDEPFAGLDRNRRDDIAPYLVALARARTLPMLVVSHDPSDFKGLGASVVEMAAGRIAGARAGPERA